MTLNDFINAHEGLGELLVFLAWVGAWSSAMLTGIFVRGLI